jgi:hypothetical protein
MKRPGRMMLNSISIFGRILRPVVLPTTPGKQSRKVSVILYRVTCDITYHDVVMRDAPSTYLALFISNLAMVFLMSLETDIIESHLFGSILCPMTIQEIIV